MSVELWSGHIAFHNVSDSVRQKVLFTKKWTMCFPTLRDPCDCCQTRKGIWTKTQLNMYKIPSAASFCQGPWNLLDQLRYYSEAMAITKSHKGAWRDGSVVGALPTRVWGREFSAHVSARWVYWSTQWRHSKARDRILGASCLGRPTVLLRSRLNGSTLVQWWWWKATKENSQH